MDYFTIDEIRDLPQMDNSTKYTDGRITKAGDWIEGIIERKCGTSFVPRQFTEIVDGDTQSPRGGLLLSKPYVLSVTAITSNGVAFDAPALALVTFRDGLLYKMSPGNHAIGDFWDPGIRNISVTGNSGFAAEPPADLKEAALSAARDWLLRRYGQQGVSDRAMSLQTEMGNTVFATANDLFRPTGIPDVDAVIMGYANELNVFGFA